MTHLTSATNPWLWLFFFLFNPKGRIKSFCFRKFCKWPSQLPPDLDFFFFFLKYYTRGVLEEVPLKEYLEWQNFEVFHHWPGWHIWRAGSDGWLTRSDNLTTTYLQIQIIHTELELEWILKRKQSFPRYRAPTGTGGFFFFLTVNQAELL